MCRTFATLALLSAFAWPAGAEDPGPEGPRAPFEIPVALVRSTHEAGNAVTLAEMAAIEEPDPWLVAEVLLAEAPEAAAAYAEAAPRPDLRELPAYLARRRDDPPREEEIAALVSAGRRRAAEDWEGILEAVPFEPAGSTVAAIQLLLWRADALEKTGDVADASETLLEAAERARSIGWWRAARNALMEGAIAAHRALRYESMVDAFMVMAEVAGEREQPEDRAQALMFLGNVRGELGQYALALARYAEARAAFEELDLPRDVARVLCNQAIVHLFRGEFRQALIISERALDLVPGSDASVIAYQAVSMRGAARDGLGDPEGSLRAYEAAYEIAKTLGDPDWIAEARGNVALGLVSVGRIEEARAELEALIEIFERDDDKPSVATALTNLGLVAEKAGNPTEALGLHERALEVAREVGDPYAVANCEQNVAGALYLLGRHDEAARQYARTAATAERLAAHKLLIDALVGEARCRMAQGRPGRALTYCRKALDELAAVLGGLAEGQGAEARASHAKLFATAAEAATRLGDVPSLANVLERGRAMAFLESLAGREVIRSVAIPPALLREEEDVRAAFSAATRVYQQALSRGLLAEMGRRRKEMEAAKERLVAIVERIQLEARAGASVVYPTVDDFRTLRARLDAGDALVLYAFLESEAVGLVVEPEAARIVPLGGRDEIEAACTGAVDAILDKREDAEDRLAELRGLVVEPLALGDATKRVLISPAGELFLVPFAALVGERDLAYVPSGTVYGVLRDAQDLRGEQVLALGGVDYGDRRRLGALPLTKDEAIAVGDVVLVGEQATEAGLREALATRPRWRALHIACHGLLDTDEPMASSLALTTSAPDDGFLSALEVFGLKVRADAVVLSACEMARGRHFQGEGLVGMTRAFMFAGAPRVVAGLWPVPDKATHYLMERLYARWNPADGSEAVPLATALRLAQEDTKKRWPQPYYWAAWTLWGLPQ